MRISFSALTPPRRGAVVVLAAEERKLLKTGARLDKATGGALTRAMNASLFKGKKNQMLEVLAPSGAENSRVIIAGIGDPKAFKDLDLQNLGGKVVAQLNSVGETQAALAVDAPGRDKAARAAWAAQCAFGARLRSYRFDRYKTKKKPDGRKNWWTTATAAQKKERVRKMQAWRGRKPKRKSKRKR